MRIAGSVRAELLVLLFLAGSAMAHNTERVSVSSAGEQGNNFSRAASISADGRFVAFVSAANNLVGQDTNGFEDIFVHDRLTDETTRVNVDSSGAEANNFSEHPSISGDGRLVAFHSWATNLVPGDTNLVVDVFVHDRETGETIRVSVSSSGEQGDDDSNEPSISDDGGFVAFTSAAGNFHISGVGGVFVHDLATGETTKVSLTNLGGNTFGSQPSISADGRFVAFASSAENIDFGDPDNDLDIYVRDRVDGTTVWASPGPVEAGNSDSQRPSISADGRYVAFESEADSLVVGGNFTCDVFVFDLQTDELIQVSVSSEGAPGDLRSLTASISADGRYVAFVSDATNFDPDDTNNDLDIYVHDRVGGQTERVSLNESGQSSFNDSFGPSSSGDARFIAFGSLGTLVAGDTNGVQDIYVRDRGLRGSGATLIGSESTGDLLLTINPDTAVPAPIGFLPDFFDGLAYDPVNDVLYGVNSVGGANDQIFILDRQTAEATPLGDPGALGIEFPGPLAFDPTRGILYIIDNLTDDLYSVDTTTGIGTLLTTITGLFGENFGGLAFDPRSDTLFGLSNAVVKIDPATGGTVPIVTDLQSIGAVGGLSFDTDRNALFATSWEQDATLHRIDPGTGEITLVGLTGGPAARVQGLAFVADQPANPCPADLDGDGAIGIVDLLALLGAWGTSPGGPPDLDGDGTVGITDFLAMLGTWGPCPVLNDMCRNSIDVTEGVFEFTTIGAVTDGPDNPECDAGGSSQIDADIWFCYTASATGSATAGLCGSGFNTKLAVYNGCACPPNGAPVACNDDSCGTQSVVTFAVTAGERYMLRVGGVDGATGDGMLSISMQSFAIPNDVCTFATPIFTPFFVEGTTIGALPDVGLPACGPPMTGPSVWYRVTGSGTMFNADTCIFGDTEYDSMITVYRGDCTDLVCVVGNDDSCGLQAGVVWQTEPDTDYFIVVHGFIGASGSFTMFVVDLGTSH